MSIEPAYKKQRLFFAVVFLFFLNCVFLAVLFFEPSMLSVGKYHKELRELSNMELSLITLENYFQALAEEKGAPYAFAVLTQVDTPPNIDMHLVAHVVGEILYEQEGFSGMRLCTSDFRNACSHSIVIRGLLEEGEIIFEKVHTVCEQAPGGKGAYTMCFHGFGHGVLAYSDYKMEKAVALCETVGTPPHRYRESVECVGGAVMEMMSGVHDREAWQEVFGTYLHADDPLSFCAGGIIPEEARSICYSYLTPFLFQVAGSDLASPTPPVIERAFAFCNTMDTKDLVHRDACFGGFGKEFVVLVQERDIRHIEEMDDEKLTRIYEWCTLAGLESGVQSCIRHALYSLYWGGENDPDVSIRFCETIHDTKSQSLCINELIESVGFYVSDTMYRERFCRDIPAQFHILCEAQLL